MAKYQKYIDMLDVNHVAPLGWQVLNLIDGIGRHDIHFNPNKFISAVNKEFPCKLDMRELNERLAYLEKNLSAGEFSRRFEKLHEGF